MSENKAPLPQASNLPSAASNIPAALRERMEQSNPANAPAKAPAKRVPLGLPTLKLSVPEIPGYFCHWSRGTQQRLERAIGAGYQFVNRDEVSLNHAGLANGDEQDGNSDLGSRVSVGDQDGIRLYLMKLPAELWREDEQLIEAKHEEIAAQLRGERGLPQPGADTSNRYSRGESRNLFTPRKA